MGTLTKLTQNKCFRGAELTLCIHQAPTIYRRIVRTGELNVGAFLAWEELKSLANIHDIHGINSHP